MSKATRRNNREARKIIRFTTRTWAPALILFWDRKTTGVRFDKANATRYQMILKEIERQGKTYRPGRLRRALVRVEPR